MGDVVSLVEKAQASFEAEEARKMQEKMVRGRFDFNDFLKQTQAVRKMGGLSDMLKMAGMGGRLDGLELDDSQLKQAEAIIHSMTGDEKADPDIIDSSRRRRIAGGAGVSTGDVSGLVKTFRRSRDLMKSISGGRLGGLKGLFSGGGIDTLTSAMAGGRKIKQRSKRKRVVRRKGKVKKR
jgi:signal recognition particle subunit SRP54